MADLAQQIRHAHLTCGICQHYYSNPKALPCHHSFCEECLRDYVFSRRYEELGHFPCPDCRKEVTLPNKGVADLPDNDYLNRLMVTVAVNEQGNGRNQRVGAANPATSQCLTFPENGRHVAPDHPDVVPSSTTSSRLYPDLSSVRTLELEITGQSYLQHTVPVKYAIDNALVCFGRYGEGLTEFTKPIGMCVSGKLSVPLIHITDQRDNRVLSFSLSGELKSVFSCDGEIYDVASDKNDTLYIASAKADRSLALTYNIHGQKTGSYGNHFTFVKPHGIVVNKRGEVVVTTLESKCFVLGKDGKTLQEFGRKTKGKEGFLSPYYVSINSKNDIIISDRDSDSIKIFDRNGKSKSSFGKYGCNKGDLHHPMGIHCDENDNMIVADAGNGRIQVFDSAGNFKYSVKTSITAAGEAIPRGVSVVSDKLVVLFTGEKFSEVRVYNYCTTTSQSKTCKPQ